MFAHAPLGVDKGDPLYFLWGQKGMTKDKWYIRRHKPRKNNSWSNPETDILLYSFAQPRMSIESAVYESTLESNSLCALRAVSCPVVIVGGEDAQRNGPPPCPFVVHGRRGQTSTFRRLRCLTRSSNPKRQNSHKHRPSARFDAHTNGGSNWIGRYRGFCLIL